MAEQMEKAHLFDFNLILPAIAIEFLLLMAALDKLYFTPLGKFMDERDANIRSELVNVKDASEEVKKLQEQATAVMKAARAEIATAFNKIKKETTAELEVKLDEGRRRVEAERTCPLRLTALASATACLRMSRSHAFPSRMTRCDSMSLVLSCRARFTSSSEARTRSRSMRSLSPHAAADSSASSLHRPCSSDNHSLTCLASMVMSESATERSSMAF
jgi:hypothetical protein